MVPSDQLVRSPAQQLRQYGAAEAWIRDERPAAVRYQVHQERLLGGAAAALVQPGYSVVSRLSADWCCSQLSVQSLVIASRYTVRV